MDFYIWLRAMGIRVWAVSISLVGILVAIGSAMVKLLPQRWSDAVVTGITNLVPPHLSGLIASWSSPVSFSVQALMIFVLLFFVIRQPRLGRNRYSADSRAVMRFHFCWSLLWFSWFMYYLTAALFEIATTSKWLQGQSGKLCGLIPDFFGNLTLLFMLLCFDILHRRSIRPLAWIPMVAVLAVFEIAKTVSDLLGHDPQGLMWAAAFAAAVTMALFVGRLESKMIDPPLWVVVLLYFYAAIQTAGAVFPRPEFVALKVTLINAGLFLKLLLFLLVYWILDSGVLMYYMKATRELDEGIRGHRRNFISQLG